MAADETVAEQVDRFGMMVMRDTSSAKEIERAAADVSEAIEALGTSAGFPRTAVLSAQRSYYLGFFYRGAGRERDAERAFEQAAELAREAVESRPTSEGQRVLSDALQQLLELHGTLYQLLNWRTARDAALEAIALDEQNPAAYLTAVSYLTTAPAAGGGDKEQARRYLDRASALLASEDDTPSTKNQRFLAAVWSGLLEAGRGRAQASERAFDRAAAIYPQNRWLGEMRKAATADLRNQ